MEERRDDHQNPTLDELVEKSVVEALSRIRPIDPDIHDKHHEYITLVLNREAKKAERWEAVIQKSLAGLVWSALSAVVVAVWTYMQDHILHVR
jgi:hypothetical protein